LARRTRERGLALNAPEATALMVDAMHWAARSGLSYPEVADAGYRAVTPDDVLDGVPDLVGEVRVEVLLDEGSRLVVLRNPLRRPSDPVVIGAVRCPPGDVELHDGRATVTVSVTNTSTHVVRVSSHFPFEQVNRRLSFDRRLAAGHHLDVPAGELVRWGPGETRAVRLVAGKGDVGGPPQP
jgi:urease subunit gamma/beta